MFLYLEALLKDDDAIVMKPRTNPPWTLKELRLHLDDSRLRRTYDRNDQAEYFELSDAVGNTRLVRCLERAKGLEVLDLCLNAFRAGQSADYTRAVPLSKIFANNTFAHMQVLRLANMWLEASKLCEVLLRHASTLTVLTLTGINLSSNPPAQALPAELMSTLCSTIRKYPD